MLNDGQATLVDGLSYEGYMPGVSEGGPDDAYLTDLATGPMSLGRCPDGADTDVNESDFWSFDAASSSGPSPGSPNSCPGSPSPEAP